MKKIQDYDLLDLILIKDRILKEMNIYDFLNWSDKDKKLSIVDYMGIHYFSIYVLEELINNKWIINIREEKLKEIGI